MRGKPHEWRVTVDGCIVSTSHKTNHDGYLSRKEEAKKYWEANRCSGTALSEMFAVSFSASCKWIREWKGVETIS